MSTEWIFERMAGFGENAALVWAGAHSSYTQLLARTSEWRAVLAKEAIGAGSVVLVEGGFSPNACALLLALIQVRAIAVPLTPLVRVHRVKFAEIAQAQASITFDAADAWTIDRHPRPLENALLKKLVARGDPGLVIFSSGSTGDHKAVLHDFSALLEKFRKVGEKKRTLSFLLFDHIGGIDTLFNTLSSGGSVVTTASRDPRTVCQAIADSKVHTLPASPTFLNLLLISEAWRAFDCSSLKVIAYGTEPMPPSTLARLGEAFPGVKLVQTYGLSELGVLRAKSKDTGSLWIKFSNAGFETRVVEGVLWVRSPSAMMGYLNAPDLFDADGWLNTEDAVEVEGDYLRILGRVTDLINVGGQKVYPAEVESVLMAMENVRDVAVYGEKSPITGQFVAARVNLVTPEPLAEFKRRLRVHCKDRLANYKIPLKVQLTETDQFGVRLKKLRRGDD